MTTLLTLDLSTANTGWALFNLATGELVKSGDIKSNGPKKAMKWTQHKRAHHTIIMMAELVSALVIELNPDKILIEQINRGMNRISQKTLDGVHWALLEYLRVKSDHWLEIIEFCDTIAWRGGLGLKLSDADKEVNKIARAEKKRKKKTGASTEIVDWKVLACRYIKSDLGLDFNPKTQNDIADAICLGLYYFKKHPIK